MNRRRLLLGTVIAAAAPALPVVAESSVLGVPLRPASSLSVGLEIVAGGTPAAASAIWRGWSAGARAALRCFRTLRTTDAPSDEPSS